MSFISFPRQCEVLQATIVLQASLGVVTLTAGAPDSALKTGPVFRGIRATVERDGLFLAAATLTDDAMAAIAVPGRFAFNPVLADMAVQAGAAWAMLRFDRMEIPFEIGALHVLGPTRDRRSVIVCRAREMSAERTVIDLVVREPDGRPVLAMDGLVLRTIEAAGV